MSAVTRGSGLSGKPANSNSHRKASTSDAVADANGAGAPGAGAPLADGREDFAGGLVRVVYARDSADAWIEREVRRLRREQGRQ